MFSRYNASFDSIRAELARGRDGQTRKVANNTYLVGKESDHNGEWSKIALRLHATDILTFDEKGMTYNVDGWFTPTTKDRLNTFGSLARIFQERGRWYYVTTVANPTDVDAPIKWNRALFVDGMRVAYDGTVLSGADVDASAEDERKATDKEIRAYCKLIREVDTLPMPDLGDCLICQMSGAFGADVEHLTSHLEEGYLVGSLFRNAIAERGYRDPMLILEMSRERMTNHGGINTMRDNVTRAVRTYLKTRLLDGRKVAD